MKKFLACERGGVTVDWVTVNAGILLLGIMVVYAIFSTGVASQTTNINSLLLGYSLDQTVAPAPDQSTFQ